MNTTTPQNDVEIVYETSGWGDGKPSSSTTLHDLLPDDQSRASGLHSQVTLRLGDVPIFMKAERHVGQFIRSSFWPLLAMTGVMLAAITAGVYAGDRPTAMPTHPPGHPASSALADEQPFLTQNDVAMQKMMADMHVEPTGNVDKDFVNMMVPHHQGAIDMAVLELRYGTSARLKALAQEIVVTQQQEIAAMRLAIGDPIPPSHASPVTASETRNHSNQ